MEMEDRSRNGQVMVENVTKRSGYGRMRDQIMVELTADAPEDYLLAHELCVVAISKGNTEARWLAAASEDRFLMSIDRPQRFGTQFRSDGVNTHFKLYKMDSGVTDELRLAL